jgi:hypothetical protein
LLSITMTNQARRRAALAVCLAFGTGIASAQPNVIPGLDVKIIDLNSVLVLGRTGAFGSGINSVGISTTSCNVGTVTVEWEAPMDPDHPSIASMIAREFNGRLEQVSNYSMLKHGFLSTNTPVLTCQNGQCQDPGTGALLGIGCSDTYGASLNGDHYWLGPADEVDPWLGTWNPIGSLFDRGIPPVPPPQDRDGIRSFTRQMSDNLGLIGNRMTVVDADFATVSQGARFWFQAGYMVAKEAEDKRENNWATRQVLPRAVVNTWQTTVLTLNNPHRYGSVLQVWDGATVSSAANGTDDGRYYVAVKVTGPNAGLYRYEYAVHNRDNRRAGGALRIPVCPTAQVSNFYFHDVDQIATNDWTMARNGGEIVFAPPIGQTNPIRWNSFYNFGFDSSASPGSIVASIDQHFTGAGAPTVGVSTFGPIDVRNLLLGAGCGPSPLPSLQAIGTPPRASLGNASFGLRASGLAPNAATMFMCSLNAVDAPLGGSCRLFIDPATMCIGVNIPSDAGGVSTLSLAVPNDRSIEGMELAFQLVVERQGGAYANILDFTNGLKVRIGNLDPGCP